MSTQVFAPFTDDQVESLKGFQLCGYFHEFTCGRCGSALYIESDGWHCSGDDYIQNWAHDFMANWEWKTYAQRIDKILFREAKAHG